MKLSNDPEMLVSILNTKLRNQGKPLEELLEDLGIDTHPFLVELALMGYQYDLDARRFVEREKEDA